MPISHWMKNNRFKFLGMGLGIVFTITLSAPSYAFHFEVQPVNSDFDASQMADPNTVIHPLSDANTPIDHDDEAFTAPSPQQRKRLINEAGLSTETAAMDALDQDHLMIRAKAYTVEEMKQYYPSFSLAKIKKLMKLLGNKTLGGSN